MRRHNGILLVLFLWRGRLRRPPRSDGRNATDPSGCEGITGLRTRTSRFDDGKGRCVGSDRRAQPRCSGPFTWPSEKALSIQRHLCTRRTTRMLRNAAHHDWLSAATAM